MAIFAVYNMKGGVGKTTTAVNLAAFCAAEGDKTLIWDLDPQGASAFLLGIDNTEEIKAKKLLKGKRKELDKHIRPTAVKGLDILPADFSNRHLDLELGEKKKSEERFSYRTDVLAPAAATGLCPDQRGKRLLPTALEGDRPADRAVSHCTKLTTTF